MTENEKQLLLKDLCARLPYGVMIQSIGETKRLGLIDIADPESFIPKPYLRPLSNMTEEEKKELSKILNYEFYVDDDFALAAEDNRHRIRLELCEGYVDWLNKHYFDYRIVPSTGKTLIKSGLALEALKDMYKTE